MKEAPLTTKTGIKMGWRWNESPKPMPIDDPDMLYIQSVLICPPKWHRQRNIESKVVLFSALFALAIGIASLMAGK